MARTPGAHIGANEIDDVLNGAAPDEVRIHLDECLDCAQMIERHRSAGNALNQLREEAVNQHGPESTDADVERYLLGPEARAALAQRMAALSQIGPATTARTSPKSRPLWFWIAGLAAAAFVIAAIFFYRRSSTTDRLIAEAYTERRPVDYRIPEAGYAPVRVTRGLPNANPPVPLLEAEAKVQRELARSPDRPSLLEQQARIDLLNWNYHSALPVLTRLSEIQPESESVQLDLALAYFEQGDAENHPIDYGMAIELLSRIVANHPKDRVALFNRALTEERIMNYRAAIADWEAYLKLDSSGGWADEARQRLQSLRTKLSARGQGVRPCSSLTAELAIRWAMTNTLSRNLEDLEGGTECLRQHAIIDWLVGFFDESAPREHVNKLAYLAAAEFFRQQAGDTWLLDLSRAIARPDAAAAAKNLADAVRSNIAVDASHAEESAQRARVEFKKLGNAAGYAQATVEYLYAIRRSKEGSKCRDIAGEISSQIDSQWRWTSLQATLETASCEAMVGDLGGAARLVRDVLQSSNAPVYASLHLRALSYLEGMEALAGDHAAAWRDGTNALRVYYAGAFAPVWGYQIYFQLASSATALRRYNLALELQRTTLQEIRLANRPSVEAFTWFDYGRTALLANQYDEARAALVTATRHFQTLPNDRSKLTALAECEVSIAQIDNVQNRPAVALDRLSRVHDGIRLADTFPLQFAYRNAWAESEKRLGREQAYESDLQTLTAASFRNLATVDDFRGRLDWAKKTAGIYRDLVRLIAVRDHDPARALNVWETYRAAPLRSASSEDGEPLAVAHAFGHAEALVYVSLDDELLLWSVRNGRVVFRSVPVSRAKLASLSRQLYALCSSPDTSEPRIRDVSRQLSDYLLRPVEEQLGADGPLWIDLDAPLASAPFAVLQSYGGLRHRPLIAFRGVTPDQKRASQPPAELGGQVLAVGVSSVPAISSLQLPPLPGAVEEAKDVASLYPNAHLVLNEQATRNNIERELPRASVIHFAGHSWNTASDTALVMAPEGGAADPSQEFLTAEDLANMDLHACRLAVLSTCSAEPPGDVLDDAVPLGLALGLIRAGAAGVLATRWDLDSASAREFMRDFYGCIKKGVSPASAADQAATELSANPGTRHPYYWGSYQFFGQP